MSLSQSLLNELEKNTCDLRCVNVLTAGGDDYEIEWIVVEHYMEEPKERVIGTGKTAIEAMLTAWPVTVNDKT